MMHALLSKTGPLSGSLGVLGGLARRLPLLACLLVALAAVGSVAERASAVPEPSPVPRRWEFRIEPGPLRLTSVDVPGRGPEAFWYFTFKVTNNTGEDRFFAPSFQLSLDNGEVIRSGRDVPRVVTETIMQRLNQPLLIDEVAIQGTLLQGPENAKEGLVIFRADDLHVDVVRLFAAGFSGETHRYVRPDTGEEVTLRKQLMLTHHISGQADPKSDEPIRRTGQRWVLR
jgi:hypothetical protein